MNPTYRAVELERQILNSGWTLGQSPVDGLDAANECRHGSLPTDRKIECDCWDAVVVVRVPRRPPRDAAPAKAKDDAAIHRTRLRNLALANQARGRRDDNPASAAGRRRDNNPASAAGGTGGAPSRITPEQLRAARAEIAEGRSVREVARRHWEEWGYSSRSGAQNGLMRAITKAEVPLPVFKDRKF